MSDQEIREWARGEGIDVPARGRVPDRVREQYDEAHPAGPDEPAPSGEPAASEPAPPGAPGAVPALAPGMAADGYADNGEIQPKPPGGMRLGRGARAARPRKAHPRVPLEDLAADGWAAMAALVGSQGLTPTARVLELQAPVAGIVLEDTLRGTLVDRLLQPIARSQGKFREVYALIGPPLIVSILTLRPELSPRLLPQLRRQLRTWVLIAGPKMKAKERQEKKALAAMGLESSGDLDREIDAMIQSLFAPPEHLAGDAGMPDAA